MKKYNLTTDVILNKKFPTELSGYNASEVDKYLDQILEDYHLYEDNLKLAENKVEEKQLIISTKDEEIQRLKIEIQNLKTQLKEVSKTSNYEVNKKLDLLLKHKIGQE